MSTTLFEQLQRLKAPQAGAIADARRKTSILFDSKEAAGKDRRTIFDLGIAGLQELIVLNGTFQQFEVTLFDENTLHFERSVENKEINTLLDKNIKKFLQHLSPYFLLRPAHLCLEWLIRRFQIQDYNRDELMALVLPYHETNAFVKVIQTFRLKESDKDWFWLKPLQKPGKPLSKSAVINRAATDKGFLNFICKNTLHAIKEFGKNAHLLQTLLNFYGSVVVGALEAASSVQEWHISTLLPSLIKGLHSGCIDFVSASYIIVARLVARSQLTTKLCNSLIKKVSVVSFDRLRRTAVLLLIWIFDSQQAASPKFTEETLLYLVQQGWLVTILSSLAKENVDIQPLVDPLMNNSIKAMREQQANDYKIFLENLLNDIEFPTATAQQVISSFLDCYVDVAAPSADLTPAANTFSDGDIIELDSEDDDVNMPLSSNVDFQSWYTEYLHKLERKYPTAFDKTIKELLSGNKEKMSSNRCKSLKMALGYRLQSFDSSACDIYASLYHYVPNIRLQAVKTLIKNRKDFQKRPQNLQLLKECLADRINDDNEEIVKQILKLSTTEILEIMGCAKFVEALTNILYKIQISPQQWSGLSFRVVQHLTALEVVQEYDNNLLFLALMSLLFPVDNEVVNAKAICEIIKSPLAEKLKFLKELHVNTKEFNINNFKTQFLDTIAAANDIPTAVELFASVNSKGEGYFKQALELYHFIILVTACLKQRYSANQSLQMFKQISVFSKKFPIKFMSKQTTKSVSKLKFIPLQLFCDFLVNLTTRTNFQNLLKQCWNDDAALELYYFLNVFEYLANECFKNTKNPEEQSEWFKTLKDLFDTVFLDPFSKVGFLANFYVYENVKAVENYAVLRLRAFKLLQTLMLNNMKNKLKFSTLHVMKICIALTTKSKTMRLEALDTLKIIYKDDHALNDFHKEFVKAVLERAEEISMDHEQFPLVFYTIIKGSRGTMGKKILNDLMDLINKDKNLEQAVFSQQLLQLLLLFNDQDILSQIMPLGLSALQKFHAEDGLKMLQEPYSKIFSLVIDHFNSQTVENILLDDPKSWQLIEQIFLSQLTFIAVEGNLKPLCCVFLESLDEYAVEKMPVKYKQDLLKLIIKTLAEIENDTVFLAANKLLKKCYLDCKPLKEIIEDMHKSKETKLKTPDIRKSITKRDASKTLELHTNSLNWKKGVVLMELLENKKKLQNTEYLIPALFELLNKCLDVEEQTLVEYTKQLILSALLHCCQKAEEDGCNLQTSLPENTFRMGQVVQCLRASQNPQTHHNALLLLSHCASIFPQQVLHNIVAIFTFMGFSVVRHDDAFSFHIINDIITSIVPILVKEKSSVIPVLKVFSDIMLDVPEHRRLPLFTKLIQTLDAEKYLWMFLCIVFEAHVIDDEKQRLLQKKTHKSSSTGNSDQVAKRIEIALELTNTFKPQIILGNCINLMKYIEQLPMQKEDLSKKPITNLDQIEATLFDINTRSAKQFRHYKYIIMQFLSAITSSREFLNQIALLNDNDLLILKPFYQNFIIRILSYVPLVTLAAEKTLDFSQQKFWKVILHNLHDVLDNAISLLSPEMFLNVVNGLLQHQLLSIRKKVVELLISKLQQKDSYFLRCDDKYFHSLLNPLADIVANILTKDDTLDSAQQNELVFLQQTALIAIKLLSKLFALKHISEFKDILGNLTNISKHRNSISKIVLATVVLCMIEISSNLKAHSLAHLPKFMPQMIEILQDQAELVSAHPPDNVCIAIVTGMQKLFETLPLFLGPYIVNIITALSSIGTRIAAQNNEKDQKSINTLQKINTIWSKIATEVPVRILVPSCAKAYNKVMVSKNYADLKVLMKLLQQSLTNAANNDLANVRNELTELFMEALEFRVQLRNSKLDMDSINSTEAAIIDVFVAWVLKLSESSFRPLYHKLYNWALQENQQKETILTYFLLTNKIAESLKSLFVLFASDFIEDAARLLNESNANKTDIEPDTEHLTIELLRAILQTLFNIFLHDSKDFVNTKRFEYLMPAIVDQLENRLVLEQDSIQKVLSDCIAQLAVDVSNDVLWKQLNYQVLLKTRTTVPEVRIFAFNCCVEIARKLGDDFTPLLPETVPFIAELFEDENPRVEKNTKKAVQELEVILGESLQKYL